MAYSIYQAPDVVPTQLESAVLQCTVMRWDGDIEHKRYRNDAVEKGWLARHNGFTVITPEGIKMLLARGLIRA